MKNLTNRNSFLPFGGSIALCALLALTHAGRAQQQAPDATKPVIVRAAVNTTTGQLVIQGHQLKPASGPPTVQIDGGTMSLVSYEAEQIIAAFPEGLYSIGGSFLLKVIAGGTGTFDLAIPTPGPQGPTGADGATGPAGPQGPPGTLALPYSGSTSGPGFAFSLSNSASNSDGVISVSAGGLGSGLRATGGSDGGTGVVGVGGGNGNISEAGTGLQGFGGTGSGVASGGIGGGFSGGAGGAKGGNGIEANGGIALLSAYPSGEGGYFQGGGYVSDGNTGGGGDGIYTLPGSNGGVGIDALSSQAGGGGTNTVAGLFEGDVTVTGNLSKSGGSFQIDHPLDPANKYLYHSFVESPDMMNIYNGNVTTDGGGNAIVTLPGWFETLNRDFRYQLTTIGKLAQACVASKILNNSFTIKTDKPYVEVSWQVTGVRQDAWANAHRIPLEEEKAQADKGHYLHPELFEHQGEPSIQQLHHPQPKRRQPLQQR